MSSSTNFRIYFRKEVIIFRVTSGEFGALSNMAPDFPVFVGGTRIATIEALYQACRYPDRPEIQAEIVDQPSPMTAKMKSKKYHKLTRPDWDQRRVNIMRWCLRVKLSQNWMKFGATLDKTGDAPIVEESRKDDFWGAKPNEDGTLSGMNVLGRLLMELRQEYKASDNEKLRVVHQPDIPNFFFLGKPLGEITAAESVGIYEGVQSSLFNQRPAE